MSVTVQDILTSVAYRKGENVSPDNSTEKARRISYINEAYRTTLQKNIYWFSEKTTTDSVINGQENYTLPTDYRDMIEVRLDGIARYPMPSGEAFDFYRYPPLAMVYKYDYANKYYYIFGNEIHLIPVPFADGTIQYRYYSWPTKLTQTTDTVVIPDQYSECLVAYAYARVAIMQGKRGDAADAFDEFNEIVKEMNKENMRRNVWGKSVGPGDFRYSNR